MSQGRTVFANEAAMGPQRSVSVVAEGAVGAMLREAILREPSLRLAALAPRFTELVVEADFPGDVVVLVGQPGKRQLAHATTAVAAGALVLVHADPDDDDHDALEQLGAIVVSRTEDASVVAARIAAARPPRRRPAREQRDPERRRPRLSAGERRALAHYVQGLTTVQVAAEMGVGYETAKTFLRRVRAKYSAVDRSAGKRAELILRAEEDGIL